MEVNDYVNRNENVLDVFYMSLCTVIKVNWVIILGVLNSSTRNLFLTAKMAIFFSSTHVNHICCRAQWKHLNEIFLMSTHNICFRGKTKKL